MKCFIRPIRIRIVTPDSIRIRFVFDSNANGRFAGPWVMENNCQAHKLNKEDAVVRRKLRKLIKDV